MLRGMIDTFSSLKISLLEKYANDQYIMRYQNSHWVYALRDDVEVAVCVGYGEVSLAIRKCMPWTTQQKDSLVARKKPQEQNAAGRS